MIWELRIPSDNFHVNTFFTNRASTIGFATEIRSVLFAERHSIICDNFDKKKNLHDPPLIEDRVKDKPDESTHSRAGARRS
jgi:hypothetical protein